MMKGYDKKRFPNLQGQIFDCPICGQIAHVPKQCSTCGNLFCSECIDTWKSKHGTCKFGCPGTSIGLMTARALINIYEDLDIKCLKCEKIQNIGTIQKHQATCGRTKCSFNHICDGSDNSQYKCGKPVCSGNCQLLAKIMFTNGDLKKMYSLISDFKPKGDVPVVAMSNTGMLDLKWRPQNCGMNVQFANSGKAIFLKQQAYVFRSVVGTQGFTSGAHYWEILADDRTQNQVKVGLSKQCMFDFNTAFCDHKFGYAFYGLGQLRHGSNATGVPFGKRFKKSGALGIYINMNNGTLHFSLNGEYIGKAFQDIELTKGTIYPAVALLHCAGCGISGQLPIPQIFRGK